MAAGLEGFVAFGVPSAALGLKDLAPSGASLMLQRLEGLTASKASSMVLKLGGLSALGLPSSLPESFTRVLDLISLSILHERQVSTR
jgi:hypothetical protein